MGLQSAFVHTHRLYRYSSVKLRRFARFPLFAANSFLADRHRFLLIQSKHPSGIAKLPKSIRGKPVPAKLLFLILTSVSLSAVAQLFLKIGVGRSGAASTDVSAGGLWSMLMSPMVIGGLGLYGLGAMLWLFVLGRVPLSVAYPFVGIGFIMTAALGVIALGEGVSFLRIAGTVLIAVGCVMVGKSV
jgi:multidrug transporter EmrE-like cation transporter